MLEQLKYQNHLNEVFEFGKDGIFVNESDLHGYEWKVTKKGNRIAALEYGVQKRNLPVVIICSTEEDGTSSRNRLFEVTEKDVLAGIPGRIIIGDYYFRCFVTKSVKKNYLTTKRWMQVTLTLTSDNPVWIRETTHAFYPAGVTALADGDATFLDYAMDYPLDYSTLAFSNTEFFNTGFVPTPFRLTIYGPVTEPVIYVNGHKYQVDCTVTDGEYLTVDAVEKTILLTASDGSKTNKFHDRARDSYVFQPISPGANTVSWDGSFGFDLTLLEERSEPLWI